MANIPEGADYRLSIFDRQGRRQAEIDASFHCIWTMAPTIGTAYYTMSTSDRKCTYLNCLPGRYVLFEHESLGNWGGVITPHNQRKWNGQKQITIPVAAAEYQFNRRRANAGSKIDGSAGAVFKELCNQANLAEDCLIRFGGSIYGGGDQNGIEDPKNAMLSDLMEKLSESTGYDWWFDPQVDPKNNRLVFNAYMAPSRGKSDNYVLKEGFNLENISGDFYTEEGYLKNDILVIGSAKEDADAPRGVAIDKPSVHKYGLWQTTEQDSNDEEGSAQSMADGILASNKEMERKYMLTALESPESPHTFRHLRTGDVKRLDTFTTAFYQKGGFGADERVRILSREYATEENKVILVSEVM